MSSILKDRLGVPGLISIIALVFAMIGGAYAANGSGGGGKLTKVERQKKKATGRRGPTGPKGPKGATGPVGPAGANGTPGAAGARGATGATGSQGLQGAPGATGIQGEQGEPGETGFTETLPPGKTETGAWGFGTTAPGQPNALVPISFVIPLSAELSAGSVHYINEAGKEIVLNFGTFELEELTSTACLGSASAPAATPGNLCIYTQQIEGVGSFWGGAGGKIQKVGNVADAGAGASTAGAQLKFTGAAEGSFGAGTWAVTEEIAP